MSFNSKTDRQSWCNQLMENCIAKKMNELLTHATSWMTVTNKVEQTRPNRRKYISTVSSAL